MKNLKNKLKALTTAALLTTLAMNFNACSEQSPVSPQDGGAQKKGLNIVKLGKSAAPMSLHKKVEKKKHIKKETGGQIILLPGSDEELLRMIYQRPPVRSVHLKRSLLDGSPLSAVVLIEAINRKKPMTSRHLDLY